MNKNYALLLAFLLPLVSSATSYLFPLEQKLDYSEIIAHVRLKEFERKAGSPDYALFKCRVEHVFKGSSRNEIEFRGHLYGILNPEKLSKLVGKEFLIFLHDPHENGRFWLFEGPRGIRPYGEPYPEYEIENEKLKVRYYPHEEYIDVLHRIKTNEAEPVGAGQPM